MTSRISSLALDARDPGALAAFWCAVLDWEVLESADDIVSIGPRGGSGTGPMGGIDLIAVPERKTVKNRLHLDLSADGLPAQAELARLLELGARRVDVGQSPDVSWVVLADPEDNEFCLLSVQESDAGGAGASGADTNEADPSGGDSTG